MINLKSFAGRKAYNVKKYVVDSTADLSDLPTTGQPGSTAFIIESSETYMLNGNQEWKKISIGSGSGSSGEDIHVASGYLDDDLNLILVFNTEGDPVLVNMGSLTSLSQEALQKITELQVEVDENKGTEITAEEIESSFDEN